MKQSEVFSVVIFQNVFSNAKYLPLFLCTSPRCCWREMGGKCTRSCEGAGSTARPGKPGLGAGVATSMKASRLSQKRQHREQGPISGPRLPLPEKGEKSFPWQHSVRLPRPCSQHPPPQGFRNIDRQASGLLCKCKGQASPASPLRRSMRGIREAGQHVAASSLPTHGHGKQST